MGFWYLVVPVLLATGTCSLPGPLFSVDLFHYGELTVGPFLLERGGRCRGATWSSSTGCSTTSCFLSGGFRVFGESIWGGYAGLTVFGTPLWWISYYFLFLYLFRDWPLLLIAALPIPLAWTASIVHWRFVLYPLMLLALAALVRKDSWPRAWLLGTLLVVGNFLVPELAYAALATVIVLVGCDLSDCSRGEGMTRRFGRTLKVSIAGVVLTSACCLLLASLGALPAFVDYYRTFAPGHELTGGLSLKPWDYQNVQFVLMILAPPLLVVLAIWYVIARVKRGGGLQERDG